MRHVFSKRSAFWIWLVMLCLLSGFFCDKGGDEGGSQADKVASLSQELEGTKAQLEQALDKVQKLEQENQELKEQRERNRFRVQEADKVLQELRKLRMENSSLKRQVARMKRELQQARGAIKGLRDRLEGKSPRQARFKPGDCVQWFGGMYEVKKPVRGRVVMCNKGSCLVHCTNSQLSYLWAEGQTYELPEYQLHPCQ